MKKSERNIVVVIAVLAIIAYGIFSIYNMNASSDIIEVIEHYDDGSEKLLFEFDANVDSEYTFDVKLGQMTIEVVDGSYRAIDVDCPKHICESMGFVRSEDVMNVIVCLPNGITIGPKGAADE